MQDLLKKKLRVVVFFVVLIVASVTVFFVDTLLSIFDDTSPIPIQGSPVATETSYEGSITFVGTDFYPEEGISYALTDSAGNEIILLKADDQKLVVSEGLTAQVFGVLSKTADGEMDILSVDRIVVKNATN